MNVVWSVLGPLLAEIQTRLDQELRLGDLAERAGLSPFRLHRLFKAALGETLRAWIERHRLERATFRMLIQDASLIEIALDCGFGNSETFARAFRRRYRRSPATWRAWARTQVAAAQVDSEAVALPDQALSATKIICLNTLHLATLRHYGSYDNVPESLFETLDDWAARRLAPGPRIWMGIGRDAPATTPTEKMRFDACLVVPEPFSDEGEITHRVLPGGTFALTTHVGPYTALAAAYATILPRLLADARYTLIGLPAVEFYRRTRVSVRAQVNHTDICLPIAMR
jgi:AraC family transcriptional regulator